jgi:hypothetical protein
MSNTDRNAKPTKRKTKGDKISKLVLPTDELAKIYAEILGGSVEGYSEIIDAVRSTK